MGILIDTTVLVSLERRGGQFEEFAFRLAETDLAIATITISELLLGVHRAKPEQRRVQRENYVESVLAKLTTYPFDSSVARVHAGLWAELSARGEIIGPHDLIIAVTAQMLGYSILTENVREFSRVPGLEVRTPDW